MLDKRLESKVTTAHRVAGGKTRVWKIDLSSRLGVESLCFRFSF